MDGAAADDGAPPDPGEPFRFAITASLVFYIPALALAWVTDFDAAYAEAEAADAATEADGLLGTGRVGGVRLESKHAHASHDSLRARRIRIRARPPFGHSAS